MRKHSENSEEKTKNREENQQKTNDKICENIWKTARNARKTKCKRRRAEENTSQKQMRKHAENEENE